MPFRLVKQMQMLIKEGQSETLEAPTTPPSELASLPPPQLDTSNSSAGRSDADVEEDPRRSSPSPRQSNILPADVEEETMRSSPSPPRQSNILPVDGLQTLLLQPPPPPNQEGVPVTTGHDDVPQTSSAGEAAETEAVGSSGCSDDTAGEAAETVAAGSSGCSDDTAGAAAETVAAGSSGCSDDTAVEFEAEEEETDMLLRRAPAFHSRRGSAAKAKTSTRTRQAGYAIQPAQMSPHLKLQMAAFHKFCVSR